MESGELSRYRPPPLGAGRPLRRPRPSVRGPLPFLQPQGTCSRPALPSISFPEVPGLQIAEAPVITMETLGQALPTWRQPLACSRFPTRWLHQAEPARRPGNLALQGARRALPGGWGEGP